MYNTLKLVLLLAIITFSAHCKAIKNTDNQQIILTSPNKDVVVQFALDKNAIVSTEANPTLKQIAPQLLMKLGHPFGDNTPPFVTTTTN